VPAELTIRPLKDIGRQAHQLGFTLLWVDEDHGLQLPGPASAKRVIRVRLEPRRRTAMERCSQITADGVTQAIQSSTVYDDGISPAEYMDVVRKTGAEALQIAKDLMAA
jgi:hypothetical protein